MAQFQKYKFALAIDEEINPTIQGRFLRISEGTFPVICTPNDLTPVELQKGIGINFEQAFTRVRIKNGSNAQTIEIYAGDGEVLDNRLVTEGGISILANALATLGKVTAGTTAVQVAAFNNNRASFLLQNNSDDIIYVGVDDTVTIATGIPVGSGQTFTITFKSSIYAISEFADKEIRFIQESN